jgi:hypothetical protein
MCPFISPIMIFWKVKLNLKFEFVPALLRKLKSGLITYLGVDFIDQFGAEIYGQNLIRVSVKKHEICGF